MRRQIQVEYRSPGKDLLNLMQWADRRGVVIVRRDDEPAYMMLTAKRAHELIGNAINIDDGLTLDEALQAYETARKGPERRAYHKLPCLGERRPLPTFAQVTAADQIFHSDDLPAEKLSRIDSHVHRWPRFLADELMRLVEVELNTPSHEAWATYSGFINLLLEHAVLRRDMPRTVPRVNVYGSLDVGGDWIEDDE